MSLKLLVVDDDRAVTDMLSTLLQLQGFDVLTANRGKDCLDVVREDKPEFLLLDLMMPDMDGWAVCKEIRRFNDLPILILSALNDPIQIASILDAGADDYLTKPVATSVLLAHIKRLVRRSTGKLLFDGIPPLRFSEGGGPLSR